MKKTFSGLSFRMACGLCLALWAAGCATAKVDWNGRVGHYSYEQAVLEMGPADKQAKLADGVIVAEWLVNRSSTYLYGIPGPYGPYYSGYVTSYTTPARWLRLMFGADGQLKEWKKYYK
jgi:hypothetical protein